MAKKIVITSGKGGVGKTTVCANLGNSIAEMGCSVVLIDVDFGLNNLDVVMGVENQGVYDIFDVLEGRCRLKQALIQDKNRKNLYILPSDRIVKDNSVTGQNIKLLTEQLSPVFDYILIDCPAGIDIGFHRAVSCADEAIVVTTPGIASLRDADKVVTILRSYKLNYIGLIVNRARGDLILGDKMMMPEDIKDLLGLELLGVLPEEDDVFLSCGKNLPKKSDSYVAYKYLAGNIITGKRKIFNVTNKYTGFWGSIKRTIKRSI